MDILLTPILPKIFVTPPIAADSPRMDDSRRKRRRLDTPVVHISSTITEETTPVPNRSVTFRQRSGRPTQSVTPTIIEETIVVEPQASSSEPSPWIENFSDEPPARDDVVREQSDNADSDSKVC
jgi:hypothetical protein